MDDLVSRQAVIEMFAVGKELLTRVLDDVDVVGNIREKYEWGLDLIESYIAYTKDLPSEQPEQKTGKWINHRNDMGHNIADCSECGEAMQWYDPDTRPNYCPNCGAMMEM